MFRRGGRAAAAEPPPAVTLSLASTHLYLGATGRYLQAVSLPEEGLPAMAEFSDGVAAPAWLWPMPGPRRRLKVSSYVTAKGTRIPAKVWALDSLPETPEAFRVQAQIR